MLLERALTRVLHLGRKVCVPENALDPSDNLVRGRVRRLVEVDDTRADVLLEVALQRRAAIGDRGEVTSSHKDC
jgi:hypothetical protein